MVADVSIQPCWRGDIDITPLSELFDKNKLKLENVVLQGCIPRLPLANPDLQFFPVNPRDLSPPFPPDYIPTAITILDQSHIPLWMFADVTWTLYSPSPIPTDFRKTTSPTTYSFFNTLFSYSPLLPSGAYTHSLLLTPTPSTTILIHATQTHLLARTLHPPSLLSHTLSIKHESPSPSPPPSPSTDPFTTRP